MTHRLRITLVALVATISAVLVPLVVAPATATGSDEFDPHGLSGTGRRPHGDGPVIEQRVTIPAGDGVPLAARIFRRAVGAAPANWRYPLIVMMGNNFDNPTYATAQDFTSYYSVPAECADRTVRCLVGDFTFYGYAVAFVSMRGTGHSGGAWNYWGAKDSRDFATVVDWFRSQAPMRIGKIGVFGASAEGTAAIAGLSGAPGLVDAAVVMQGITDMYEEYGHDGAVFAGAPFAPVLDYGVAQDGPRWDPNSTDPRSDPTETLAHPQNVGPNLHQGAAASRAGGKVTPFFQERDYKPRAGNIDAPLLFVQGLNDNNVFPVNLTGWWDRVPAFKRLILPKIGHGLPWSLEGQYPWWETFHAWFDYFLMGLDTGVREWPAVQVEEGTSDQAMGTFRRASSLHALTLRDEVRAFGGPDATTGLEPHFGEAVPVTVPLGAAGSGLHLSGMSTITLDLSSITATPATVEVELQEVAAAGTTTLAASFCRYAPERAGSGAHDHCATRDDGRGGVEVVLETAVFDRRVADGATLQLAIRGATDGYRLTLAPAPTVRPAGSGYVATLGSSSSVTLPIADDSHPLHIATAGTACALQVNLFCLAQSGS